jgi:hypothetical protein
MTRYTTRHRPRIFNVSETCSLLTISRPKLLQLDAEGILPSLRTPKRWRKFRERDVLKTRLMMLDEMGA